tara:strand:+ start:5587 stop:8562 length:2976 start_codon:yes stop_codon:yes gene_type:complete
VVQSWAQESRLEAWQQAFLDELKQHYNRRSVAALPGIEHYAAGLSGLSPELLLKILDRRLVLRPYRGSMVDPVAVLMGGSSNSLDRARLMAALLADKGRQVRIVYAPSGKTSIAYPVTTPPSLQTAPVGSLADIERHVQRNAPGLFRRLCPSAQACADWPAQEIYADKVYWAQINTGSGWQDLVPADTHLSPAAMVSTRVLSEEELQQLRWMIDISVSNSYGNRPPVTVLKVKLPAAQMHAQPITYDNLLQTESDKFLPALSFGDEVLRTGQAFSSTRDSEPLHHQTLHIALTGPGEQWRHSRLLAKPVPQAGNLQMVVRARITIATGPDWTEATEYLQTRTLDRLANLLYAPHEEREDSPINLTSFRALSLLSLSRRFSGHVGLVGPTVYSYQGRPAVIIERLYPSFSGEDVGLFSSFDLLDMGNSVYCSNCSQQQRRQAAVEQGLLDGYLEDAVMVGEVGMTSHRLTLQLLKSGKRLSSQLPRVALWADSYNNNPAGYRLATVDSLTTGWRLDPGPQLTPLLGPGTGGASSQVMAQSAGRGGRVLPGAPGIYNPFSQGVSGFVMASIRHASTKCGATDIGGSIILALAGAPMTAPLLSGIVGHMCRTAEAYNKAASALNCLEFMGNDCSAEKHARDLEKMLGGLGRELGIDLALAQAMDIAFGMVIDGAVAPAIRNWWKKWRNQTPRSRARARGEDIGPDGSRTRIEEPESGRLPDPEDTGGGRVRDPEDAGGGRVQEPEEFDPGHPRRAEEGDDAGGGRVQEPEEFDPGHPRTGKEGEESAGGRADEPEFDVDKWERDRNLDRARMQAERAEKLRDTRQRRHEAPPFRGPDNGTMDSRRLVDGDSERLGGRRYDDDGAPLDVGGQTEGLMGRYRPIQDHVYEGNINKYAQDMIEGKFDWQTVKPEDRITLGKSQENRNVVVHGHHRFVGAHIAAEATGRPVMAGAPGRGEPIIPDHGFAPRKDPVEGMQAYPNFSIQVREGFRPSDTQ